MSLFAMLTWLLAAAAGGAAAQSGFEPSDARYPLRGVDVSHYQGTVDWPTLAGAGTDFAYIKATEGGDFRDPRFRANWRGAAGAGIARGAYHFFTFCRTAEAQAANFIASVPRDVTALPPAVDLEFGGNCARRPGRAVFLRALKAFLDKVELHYGKKPVLYVTYAFHTRYLRGALPDHAIWIRSLQAAPELKGRNWVIWQFHDKGRRPGVTGPVDLNVFYGDRAEFKRWRKTGRQRASGPAPAAGDAQ